MAPLERNTPSAHEAPTGQHFTSSMGHRGVEPRTSRLSGGSISARKSDVIAAFTLSERVICRTWTLQISDYVGIYSPRVHPKLPSSAEGVRPVVCWGDNGDGQTIVPADLASAAQFSAGINHSCALKTDGTVVCWGQSYRGQSTVPVGLAPVAQISAGVFHNCALKTDGTVVCWGQNALGQATVPAGLNRIVAANPTSTVTSSPPQPAPLHGSYSIRRLATTRGGP